ncbi:hypothetical protein, partial [Cocleimonas flava]
MNSKTTLVSTQQASMTSRLKSPLLSATFSGLVMCSVSVVSHAAEPEYKDMPAFTLKVVTHGEGLNRSDNMSEETRQDNRRADLSITKQVPAGSKTVKEDVYDQVQVKVSDANKRSIRLKDGGVIWVSKDPSTLTPVLNVTAPNSIEMEKGEFVSPMNFEITTNYAHFIDSWELEVYYAEDEQQKNPLATFMGRSLDTGRTIKWNGSNKKENKLKEGDKLSYILTVKDKDGHLDRTHLRQISLVGPQRNITDTVSSSVSSNLENNLDLQTIPVHGSRVRIFGRDIPTDHTIKINDESISLVENKFVVEKLLPEGQHD